MSINITAVKNLISPGTRIPMKQYGGNIGIWAEQQFIEAGFPVNSGYGPDLPTNLEIRTRNVDAESGVTVATMQMSDIISTPWSFSNVHNKSQRWYYIEYSDKDSVVLESYILDLRDPFIQQSLRIEYEYGRSIFKAGISQDDRYFSRDRKRLYAYWEKKTKNGWSFRITDDTLRSWISIQSKSQHFNTLFTTA